MFEKENAGQHALSQALQPMSSADPRNTIYTTATWAASALNASSAPCVNAGSESIDSVSQNVMSSLHTVLTDATTIADALSGTVPSDKAPNMPPPQNVLEFTMRVRGLLAQIQDELIRAHSALGTR